MPKPLAPHTRRAIAQALDRLDGEALGAMYCDDGGATWWKEKRRACVTLGVPLAEALLDRVSPKGRSLYVGAGVAEVPMLAAETSVGHREAAAYNLREAEVALLNQACPPLPVRFLPADGTTAEGTYDHLWVVSVFNDPERFPELSALSYGRANPVTFDPEAFTRERAAVRDLVDRCLRKLARPGLVTTSVEELSWVTDWCVRRGIAFAVDEEEYPTAIVEDPVCFIRVGEFQK
ncbi:MAG: hypothetical protein ACREI3_07325 [Nitrospirales bacterium]